MDIFKDFIKENPNKILGELITVSGEYGEEQVVKGKIDNLRIKPPPTL